LKSFSSSLGQTVRAVKDSSQVLARQRRWVDGNVTSRSLVFDSSNVVIFTDTGVVGASSMSRAELSFVVARRDGGFASVKLIHWATLVWNAGTVGEGSIVGKRNEWVRAPCAGKVQVVGNTLVTIGLVKSGKILTFWWRRCGNADIVGRTSTVLHARTSCKGGISGGSGLWAPTAIETKNVGNASRTVDFGQVGASWRWGRRRGSNTFVELNSTAFSNIWLRRREAP